ncbi:DNA metabolism protein, partial [Salmonella enterica subsp. enterica serovar Enteritidis str. 13183-1]
AHDEEDEEGRDGEDDAQYEGDDAARLPGSLISRPGSLAISAPGCARHPHVLRVRCGGCAHAGTELAAPPTAFYSRVINC